MSEFSRREIERVTGTRVAQRVRVIPQPVAPERQAPAARSAGPLLVVGAVRPYKGVDTIIAALALLERSAAQTS